MPHQCTNCGRTFADGSKEMLSGCPNCSGTKFQFQPDGFDDASPPPESDGPVADGDSSGDAVSRTVGSAASTVRDLVAGSAGPDATSAQPRGETGTDDDIIVAESEPPESHAQADARSGVADPDEIADGADPDPSTDSGSSTAGAAEATVESAESDDATTAPDRSVADEPDAESTDRPDLSELRRELNEQFESIRVVEPGQYELNLMELYDREEYIIALQEDGRYSIQVPDTWHETDG